MRQIYMYWFRKSFLWLDWLHDNTYDLQFNCNLIGLWNKL